MAVAFQVSLLEEAKPLSGPLSPSHTDTHTGHGDKQQRQTHTKGLTALQEAPKEEDREPWRPDLVLRECHSLCVVQEAFAFHFLTFPTLPRAGPM